MNTTHCAVPAQPAQLARSLSTHPPVLLSLDTSLVGHTTISHYTPHHLWLGLVAFSPFLCFSPTSSGSDSNSVSDYGASTRSSLLLPSSIPIFVFLPTPTRQGPPPGRYLSANRQAPDCASPVSPRSYDYGHGQISRLLSCRPNRTQSDTDCPVFLLVSQDTQASNVRSSRL